LKERIRVIVSVLLSFLLVTFLVQNYRHQRETDQRLKEVQKAVQASINNSARAGSDVAVTIHERGSNDDSRGIRDAEEILNKGWKLVNQRSPEQARRAVRLFEDGIAENPASADLYNGLGRALLIAGRPREAIAAWRKGLRLAPNLSDMQSGIGWAYWWLNDPYRATEAWERALVLNPRSVDAWSAMAWIDLALGKPAEAKRGFEELVKFESGRKSWVMGLSMAQGHNTNFSDVTQFFSLPALDAFKRPLPIDPAPGDSADAGDRGSQRKGKLVISEGHI
jgi:tetratricopeptide (TPR) repeat protein